jgi:glycosyltransferase involved in cell wall biosynthesis
MVVPYVHELAQRLGGSKLDLSIVVPTYNGERTISDCLESIRRAVGHRRAEIIVVDSSTDATPDIVRRYFPDFTLLRSEQRLSAGGARNRGTALARGRLIFFTDQDCMVPADWIDRLEEHFSDATVDGAGGAVSIRNLSSASGCALYFLEFLYHFPGARSRQRDERFLVGCNAAYRAGVVKSVPFPDQTVAEDVLFWHQLRSGGFHTVHDPSIEVLHQNKTGWKVFFAYNHQIGRAAAVYHAELGFRWTAPFLRYPSLALAAPMVILPLVIISLLRSRPAYLSRFALVAPMCLLGNLAWARGFQQQAREMLTRGRPPTRPRPPGVSYFPSRP